MVPDLLKWGVAGGAGNTNRPLTPSLVYTKKGG